MIMKGLSKGIRKLINISAVLTITSYIFIIILIGSGVELSMTYINIAQIMSTILQLDLMMIVWCIFKQVNKEEPNE